MTRIASEFLFVLILICFQVVGATSVKQWKNLNKEINRHKIPGIDWRFITDGRRRLAASLDPEAQDFKTCDRDEILNVVQWLCRGYTAPNNPACPVLLSYVALEDIGCLEAFEYEVDCNNCIQADYYFVFDEARTKLPIIRVSDVVAFPASTYHK